jgi:hypothetical protein
MKQLGKQTQYGPIVFMTEIFLLMVGLFGGVSQGCQKESANEEVVLEVISGISFGFCAGYCDRQLILDSQERIFVQKATRQTDLPDKSCTLTPDPGEWKRIASLVDEQFFKLDTLYGCPDCADQGREYFIVKTNLRSHKVEIDPVLKSDIHPIVIETRLLRDQIVESKSCD